jgi:predicted N-acetyltransferase YhbS
MSAAQAVVLANNLNHQMNDIVIRPAVPGDARALSDIAWRAKGGWGYSSEWLEEWREALTVTPEYLALHRSWVAIRQGHVTAWCALESSGESATLDHLWVVPEHQGQGIGRQLVVTALLEARQAGIRRVLVEADPNAEDFYIRVGARRVGERPAPMRGAPERVLPLLVFTIHEL